MLLHKKSAGRGRGAGKRGVEQKTESRADQNFRRMREYLCVYK